eukprot:1591588-Prymnesium_polylepis.1
MRRRQCCRTRHASAQSRFRLVVAGDPAGLHIQIILGLAAHTDNPHGIVNVEICSFASLGWSGARATAHTAHGGPEREQHENASPPLLRANVRLINSDVAAKDRHKVKQPPHPPAAVPLSTERNVPDSLAHRGQFVEAGRATR